MPQAGPGRTQQDRTAPSAAVMPNITPIHSGGAITSQNSRLGMRNNAQTQKQKQAAIGVVANRIFVRRGLSRRIAANREKTHHNANNRQYKRPTRPTNDHQQPQDDCDASIQKCVMSSAAIVEAKQHRGQKGDTSTRSNLSGMEKNVKHPPGQNGCAERVCREFAAGYAGACANGGQFPRHSARTARRRAGYAPI